MIIVKQNETKFWHVLAKVIVYLSPPLGVPEKFSNYLKMEVPHWFIIMFSLKIAILVPH